MTAPGIFITLEGGEGAGKSTLAKALGTWLAGRGRRVVTTREPGGSPRAETLREILLAGLAAPFGPAAEALLFALARHDHVRATIRPALDSGAIVLCDRFHDSTWAYQGAAGVDPAELDRLDAIALGALRPDMTLLLDVEPRDGLARAASRTAAADRFERDDLAIHLWRRRIFLDRAAAEPDRFAVIDANRRPDIVVDEARAAIADRLGARLSRR